MFRLLSIVFASLVFTFNAWAAINVNTASEGELTSLPGIGPAKAAAIVQVRTQTGPFKSLSDLDAVPGIGPATLTNITPMVIFADDGKAAVAVAPKAQSSEAAPSAGGVNINAADASGLQNLPGIGPSKANAIVADRTSNGPFASCSDLQRVRGVGPATVAGIATVCTTK
jgi:competence ComEA-like helix-hairpin-helix protein